MRKRQNRGKWALAFLLGLLIGTVIGTAFAQLPPVAGETVFILREISETLKKIEQHLGSRP